MLRPLEFIMDNGFYYDAVDRMQKSNVDPEYIQGWIGGYMKNPKREEQRCNDAYEAGYTDGENRETGNFENWTGA
jgi:hypothetical protein